MGTLFIFLNNRTVMFYFLVFNGVAVSSLEKSFIEMYHFGLVKFYLTNVLTIMNITKLL